MNRTSAIKILKAKGIKTIADLDHHKGNNSRYSALKALIGEDAADWMLNDLAIDQCALDTIA